MSFWQEVFFFSKYPPELLQAPGPLPHDIKRWHPPGASASVRDFCDGGIAQTAELALQRNGHIALLAE